MGCMGFGDAANGQHSWTVDEAHSREIIRRGLELGVNFFDTAIAYQSGTSEQYLGRRCVISQSAMMLLWRHNSCRARLPRSKRASRDSSTLSAC
jgi:predicted aldo/keto reductase-like oxidoreductase